MVDQRWPIKVGARWAWQSIKPTPKCPCHMRVLCEKRVLDLVVETRMQQGILGFVKRNYCMKMLTPHISYALILLSLLPTDTVCAFYYDVTTWKCFTNYCLPLRTYGSYQRLPHGTSSNISEAGVGTLDIICLVISLFVYSIQSFNVLM